MIGLIAVDDVGDADEDVERVPLALPVFESGIVTVGLDFPLRSLGMVIVGGRKVGDASLKRSSPLYMPVEYEHVVRSHDTTYASWLLNALYQAIDFPFLVTSRLLCEAKRFSSFDETRSAGDKRTDQCITMPFQHARTETRSRDTRNDRASIAKRWAVSSSRQTERSRRRDH